MIPFKVLPSNLRLPLVRLLASTRSQLSPSPSSLEMWVRTHVYLVHVHVSHSAIVYWTVCSIHCSRSYDLCMYDTKSILLMTHNSYTPPPDLCFQYAYGVAIAGDVMIRCSVRVCPLSVSWLSLWHFMTLWPAMVRWGSMYTGIAACTQLYNELLRIPIKTSGNCRAVCF